MEVFIFPFDRQMCNVSIMLRQVFVNSKYATVLIKLYLRFGDSNAVQLVADSDDAVSYKGPENLRLFRVGMIK